MAGVRIASVDGIITLLARQLASGEWIQEVETAPGRWVPVGPPEKLSVGVGAVVSLSPPGTATIAMLFVETNTIRMYDDGSTPTTGAAGNGAPIAAGSALEISLSTFANLKMIGLSGTATVHVLYYKVF